MKSAGLILLAASLAQAPSPAADVRDESYVAPDGTRVLRQSLDVPATPRDVWDAFTTTEGVRSWAVPVAHVDFRLGGIWESTYDLDGRIGAPGNIKNQILSYVPLRMVSFQAIAAPPTFPFRDLLKDIFTVVEIDDQSPGLVRVTVSMMGYRTGEGYDTIYRHFAAGNAYSLRQLKRRFVEGRRQWGTPPSR
jgi:uncharacterized protein YndB with AHSA1/START domain